MANLIGTNPSQVPVNGMLGTAAFIDTAQLPVSDPALAALETKLEWVAAPAAADSTGIAGQVAYDASYIYVCTATNTWKRVAIATW